MQTINLSASSVRSIRASIRKAEKTYNDAVTEVGEQLASVAALRYLLLSGPSCSGKTTTAAKVAAVLEAAGRRVKVISIDDYYKVFEDLERTSENGDEIDFESVNSIDLACLRAVVKGLTDGETVQLPKYDFSTNHVTAYETFTPEQNDVYIFEGIQAMYPEVMELFPTDATRRLFVTIHSDIIASGVEIDKAKLRLIRRIVRDFQFRAADPAFTLSLWHNVRANEIQNIMPNIRPEDIVVDTLLPYEVYLLSRRLVALAPEVPQDDEFAGQFKALCDLLMPLTESAMTEDMVPADSMLREFIGPKR